MSFDKAISPVAGAQTISKTTLNSVTTLAVPSGATIALITVVEETEYSGLKVRFTTDGTTPVAGTGASGTGHRRGAGPFWIRNVPLFSLKFINETTDGCHLRVEYFKR
jgi:hypothetical protein